MDLSLPATTKPGAFNLAFFASPTTGAVGSLLTFTLRESVNGTALPLTLATKAQMNATSVQIYIPTYAGGKSFRLTVTNAAAATVYAPPAVLFVSPMNWDVLFAPLPSWTVRSNVPFSLSFDWTAAGYSVAAGPAGYEKFGIQLMQNNGTYTFANNNISLSNTYAFSVIITQVR